MNKGAFNIVDSHFSYGTLWFVCGCLLALFIIFISLYTAPPVPSVGYLDKISHIIGYCVLMFWWAQLYSKLKVRLLLSVVFIVMGVAIEWVQSYHPLRYFDVFDMLANIVGVTFGLMLSFTLLGQLLVKAEKFFISNMKMDN